MIYNRLKIILILSLINFLVPLYLYAKGICVPLRNYDIDIFSNIMSQSLKWQKDFVKFFKEDSLSPFFIVKIMQVKPGDELIFSLNKNEFQIGYFLNFNKQFYISFDGNNFYGKSKKEKPYKRIHQHHYKFYDRFTFSLIKLENSGLIIIYDKNKMSKNLDINFHIMTSHFVYLCPLNIEYPFKIQEIFTPYGFKSNYFYLGYIIFENEGNYYKLNIYKDPNKKEKEFISYYVDASSLTKFLSLKRKRDNLYILDFNKSYFPYCIFNDKLICPKNDKSKDVILNIKAGQKII